MPDGKPWLALRLFQSIGLLAFGGGFGLFALAFESVGQAAMCFGIVGVFAEGVLKALDGVVELALLEEGIAGICGDSGALPMHHFALEVGAFFAFGGGFGGVSLLRKDCRQCEVRFGLVRQLANGFPESGGGLGQLVHFAVETAKSGPAIGIVGMELHRERQFAGSVVVTAVL